MKPDEIKALRKELRCTAHELAEALGVTFKTVMAWEQDEMFPTRRFVTAMDALREQGPGAVPRKRRSGGKRPGSSEQQTPMQALSSPQVWQIVRKLLAHHELREQVARLAENYADPE